MYYILITTYNPAYHSGHLSERFHSSADWHSTASVAHTRWTKYVYKTVGLKTDG